ncbi:MAG: DUF4242 domain-containing protein [Gemmatimonadales bacterium]
MPKFLIQRELPGAGGLSPDELRALSRRSNEVLERLGSQIQWVETYVTGDRLTCVYIAPDAALVRRHATEAGFPADRVDEIATIMDPTTAEEPVMAR